MLPHMLVTEEVLQDPDYGNTSNQMRKNAKRLSLLLNYFQTQWKHEYFSLREFHRSHGNNNQTVKVGDIVQIHDKGPRLSWHLAVIEESITGNDGLVRVAIIRTSTGHINHPVIKLYIPWKLPKWKQQSFQIDNLLIGKLKKKV